jgi:CarboxypepD_reg-like domain/TonB-dependent Receptor Plug Domain
MKNKTYLLTFFLTISIFCLNAQKINIHGYVKDATTNETLIGANIYTTDKKQGCATNNYGYYSFDIPFSNLQEIEISFIGYATKTIPIFSKKDTTVDIYLSVNNTLSAVEITEKKSIDIKHGVLTLPVETLKSVPVLGGEPDILKALSFLPGIATGAEGSAGLYVRGGTPDQNLILIDDAVAYNTSHLFGFMSIINPNAVKSINTYKGGFPARYGGRLSSVIDITMREGNNKRKHTEGGIGLVTSNILKEGPIKENKSSYIVSARAAYFSLLTLLTRLSYAKGGRRYINFLMYDLNAKVNFDLSKKEKLFISAYASNDYFDNWNKETGEDSRSHLQWGNRTATVRYTNILKPNLFFSSTLTYNDFAYKTDIDNVSQVIDATSFKLTKTADVKDILAKASFDWAIGNQSIKFGTTLGQHFFEPNNLNFYSKIDTTEITLTTPKNVIKPQSAALFIEDDIRLSSQFSLNIGARWFNYFVQSTYQQSIEPRLLVSYQPNKYNKVDASLTRMGQNVHLLSASTGAFGNDIWVTATKNVPLANSNQVALSYTRLFDDNKWYFQFETYYKQAQKLIDYRQGTNIFQFDTNWEDAVEKNGIGRDYGFEFFLKKEGEKTSGWISYTLAWSERQFANINGGDWFPQRYDRRHNLNIVFEQKLGEKWTFNSDFVFQTGSRITLPTAVVKDDKGLPVAIYTDKNNATMPNYHRLDVAITKAYVTKKRGRDAKFSFSVYNLYGRKNPFAVNYTIGIRQLPNDGKGYFNIIRTQSVFRFIPGLNWSVKF